MAKKSENPDHRRSPKIRYGLEPVRESFLALGEFAEPFLSELQIKQPRNAGVHARIILAMKENYYADDINKALKHAIGYYAFDGKAIERILAATARKRTLESFRNEKAKSQLEKVLPKVKQRPLGEYSALISRGDNK